MIQRKSGQLLHVNEEVSSRISKLIPEIDAILSPENNARTRYSFYEQKLLPIFKDLLFIELQKKLDSDEEKKSEENSQSNDQEQGDHEQGDHERSTKEQNGSESEGEYVSSGDECFDDFLDSEGRSHEIPSEDDLRTIIAADPMQQAEDRSNREILDASFEIGPVKNVFTDESTDVNLEMIQESRDFYYSVLSEISSLAENYARRLQVLFSGRVKSLARKKRLGNSGSLDVNTLIRRVPGIVTNQFPQDIPPVFTRKVRQVLPNQIPSMHVAFVLDCSGSMEDFLIDVKKFFICVSRLFIAYSNFLEDKRDFQITLVAYGSDAIKLMPVFSSSLSIHEQFICSLPYLVNMGDNNEGHAFSHLDDSEHEIKSLYWFTDGCTDQVELSSQYILPLKANNWNTYAIGLGKGFGSKSLEEYFRENRWDELFEFFPNVNSFQKLLEILFNSLKKNI